MHPHKVKGIDKVHGAWVCSVMAVGEQAVFVDDKSCCCRTFRVGVSVGISASLILVRQVFLYGFVYIVASAEGSYKSALLSWVSLLLCRYAYDFCHSAAAWPLAGISPVMVGSKYVVSIHSLTLMMTEEEGTSLGRRRPEHQSLRLVGGVIE